MKKGIDYTGVSVNSVIHDGEGKVLLMKRSEGARDEHGRWDICGGALEFGEEFRDAIYREVKEELCTVPLETKYLTAYEAHREHNGLKTHWVAVIYAAKVDPAAVKIGEPNKFDEIGWFNLNNLPKPHHSQLHKSVKAAKGAGILA